MFAAQPPDFHPIDRKGDVINFVPVDALAVRGYTTDVVVDLRSPWVSLRVEDPERRPDEPGHEHDGGSMVG